MASVRRPVGSSPPTSGSSKSSSSRRSARSKSQRRAPSSSGPSGVCSAAVRPAAVVARISEVDVAPALALGDARRELRLQIGRREVGRLQAPGGRACRPACRRAWRRAGPGPPAASRRPGDRPARHAADARRLVLEHALASGSLPTRRLVRPRGDVAERRPPPARVQRRDRTRRRSAPTPPATAASTSPAARAATARR